MTTTVFKPSGGTSTAYWDDPTVWSTGTVPNGADADVIIPTVVLSGSSTPLPSNVIVRAGQSFQTRSVSVSNNALIVDGSLDVDGTLALPVNSSLVLSSGAVRAGAIATAAGALLDDGQVTGTGLISYAGAITSTDLGFSGNTLRITGRVDGPVAVNTATLVNTGAVSGSLQPSTFTVGDFSNSGDFAGIATVTTTGTFNNTGTLRGSYALYGADNYALTLDVAGGIFTNVGTLTGRVTVSAPGRFSNFVGGTLTGGTYTTNNQTFGTTSQTMRMDVGGTLTVDAAALNVNGTDLLFVDPLTQQAVAVQDSLRTIAATGSLTTATFAAGSLDVAGLLALVGVAPTTYYGSPTMGSFSASQLTVEAGGRVTGVFDTVSGPVTNNGTIAAVVGSVAGYPFTVPTFRMRLAGAVMGSGILEIGPGTSYLVGLRSSVVVAPQLEVGGPTANSVVFDDARGTLLLDDPTHFTGTIQANVGNAITLAGLGVGPLSATYSGDATGGTLAIDNNGTRLALRFKGDFDRDSFALAGSQTADGGSALVVTVTQPAAPPPTQPTQPEPPAPPATPSPATLALFGSVTHDAASPGGIVDGLYHAILARAADPLGLEGYAAQIGAGAAPDTVAAALLGSAEYAATFAPAAQSDRGFLEELYAYALGRSTDEGGRAAYEAQLAGGTSRADVATSIATSDEAATHRAATFEAGLFVPSQTASSVARLYYGLLDRAPDAGGFADWQRALGEGRSLDSIAQAFLDAPERQAAVGTPDDAGFVTGLYEDALGRAPDPGGLQGYEALLAQGTSRATVALDITQSFEAQGHLAPNIEVGLQLA